MARVGTPLGNLGTWIDEENPGAGSQVQDNTGLNGNWLKIDLGLFTQHNADGTHKSDIIDGINIKNTAVDGATLETSATSGAKTLRIKDLGVTTAKINAAAVTTAKIASAAITNALMAVDAIDTNKIVDNAVASTKLNTNAVTTVKILDANVTTAKLEYKEYVALISQASTANPSATVVKNTLSGTPTWTRSAAGSYLCTLTGQFTVNKTVVILQATNQGLTMAVPLSVDVVWVQTQNSSWTAADGILSGCSCIIRVYP